MVLARALLYTGVIVSLKKGIKNMLNEETNPITQEKSFDCLSGDDTQFEDVSEKRLPDWAKSSAATLALGQFNLTNNRAFKILASKIKKVS